MPPSDLTSISFPASPSVGSTYTYGNQTYQWNGTEWVVSYDSNSIPIGAVTLSGNQTITGTKSFSSLNLTSLLNNADFTITNQNGYLQLGPLNSSYCHLNTDRPAFYLNRKIENGEGIFASYSNTDLKLSTYNTTRLTILNSNGNVGIATENPQTRLDIVVPSTGTTLTGTAKYAGIHLDQNNTNDEFVGITTSATSSGTQGGILFQGSGTYGTKIHFLTTDQYAVGMQNRMTLDNFGNLSIVGSFKNNNPSFHVHGLAAEVSTQPGTFVRLVFNNESFDNLGNIASGLFTAPVAGVYHFTASIFGYVGGTSPKEYFYWIFRKNGSQYGGYNHSSNTGATNYINYQTVTASCIMSLAAGDTVDVALGGGVAYSSNYSNFCGYLIG